MVTCQRCRNSVDERGRTVCPVCQAPISPAPAATNSLSGVPTSPQATAPAFDLGPPQQPGAFSPGPQPGYTGSPAPGSSSMPVAAGLSAGAPYSGGPTGTPLSSAPLYGAPLRTAPGSYTPSSGLPPPPPYSAAPRVTPPGSYTPRPAPKSNTSGVGWISGFGGIGLAIYIALRVGVAVLAHSEIVPGIFGSAFDGSPVAAATYSDPAAVAREALTSVGHTDWRRFYYLAAFEPNHGHTAREADEFVSEIQRGSASNPSFRQFESALNRMTGITIGKPNLYGDTADASSSATIQLDGETLSLKGTAHLVREHGRWLIDLTTHPGHGQTWAFDELVGVNSMTASGVKPSFFHPGMFTGLNAPIAMPPVPQMPRYTPPSYGQPAGGYGSGNASNSGSPQPGFTIPRPVVPQPSFPQPPAMPRFGPYGSRGFPSPPYGGGAQGQPSTYGGQQGYGGQQAGSGAPSTDSAQPPGAQGDPGSQTPAPGQTPEGGAAPGAGSSPGPTGGGGGF